MVKENDFKLTPQLINVPQNRLKSTTHQLFENGYKRRNTRKEEEEDNHHQIGSTKRR